MRFVIVGPGALGSVFGAHLARGDHEVTLLGRPSPHLQAIRENGLRLETSDGGIQQVAIAATEDPAIAGPAKTIIVLVKTGDTSSAMHTIAPYVHGGQTVLTLQNGIGNGEHIRAALGEAPRILPGVTSQAAIRVGPGAVSHTGEGPTIIGFIEQQDAPAARKLAETFTAAGLPSAAVPDIERWIWHKVAVNAAINGLTALGGFPNGTIARYSIMLDAAETIAEEAATVARAQGIELGGMRRAVLEIASATAKNRSSMLQDLDARRSTEIATIHEAIMAAGERTGVATPTIQLVSALIRAKEREFAALEYLDGE